VEGRRAGQTNDVRCARARALPFRLAYYRYYRSVLYLFQSRLPSLDLPVEATGLQYQVVLDDENRRPRTDTPPTAPRQATPQARFVP
jgi:hypothetical protein